MQVNRNIHLCQEKAPIYKLSRSKAPKTQQTCGYTHTRKTSGLFNDFSSRNNLANLGSLATVSVPVGSIIPWLIKKLLSCPVFYKKSSIKLDVISIYCYQ